MEWMEDKMISPLQVQDQLHLPSRMHPTMAATPEELLRVVEPAPSSPPVFLDLPSTPHGDSQQQDDLALDYISRMLMEEDIVDNVFYQYPDDATVLQAEQPFAEILSASGTSSSDAQQPSAPTMLASALLPAQRNDMGSMVFRAGVVQNPALFLNGTGAAETNSRLFPGEGIISMDMLSSMAFFRGMEEAKRFLPRDNGMVGRRGRKNRFDGDGEMGPGMGRSSKQIATPVQLDSEEESSLCERLYRLIFNCSDMWSSETQEPGVAMEKKNKAAQQSIYRKTPRGRRRERQGVVADLEALLLRCAEAVATNDRGIAGELLERIKRHSSLTGDATERLAHYIAKGLEARLAGTGSQLYRSLLVKRTSDAELLKAKYLYMSACCFLKVSFHFANKTIYDAVAGRKKLHIVHYGCNEGFQWPGLLRWLADREGGPPEVRITGISPPPPGLCPSEETEEAGHWLSDRANRLGVPFKFRAIAARSEAVRAEDLDIDPDEVLVVNSLFHFKTLMDESLSVYRVNPRDLVLCTIRKMRPSVFVLGVINGPFSAAFFATRFREALYNYRAQFDMMETTMRGDNDKRMLLERDIFARSAINIIACEGADRVERPQSYREWQARNQRAGLRQLPLDPGIVQMLKDTVKKQYHKHFMVNEDHRWLLQGWKGRVLYALSTWAADDASGID